MKDGVRLRKKVRPDLILRHLAKRHKGDLFLCFYFACPAGLIGAEEPPPEVGLIYYHPDRDTISTKKRAAYRGVEIPREMLYYIIITRLESDRHPFFSDRREFLEAWVQDRAERRSLAVHVRSKMFQRIEELEREVSDLRWEVGRLERAGAELERIRSVLVEAGLVRHLSSPEDLRRALASGVPPQVVKGIEAIEAEARRLRSLLKGEG